jgi:hypothetical protein
VNLFFTVRPVRSGSGKTAGNETNTIMFPGPSGSPENHKKGYCSDGVKQVMKADTVPDWPQPQGIFEAGTRFHLLKFLETVHTVYNAIAFQESNGGDLSMEYEAFVKMLSNRMIFLPDGRCLFRLFDLDMLLSTHSQQLIVNHEGTRYLLLTSLNNCD